MRYVIAGDLHIYGDKEVPKKIFEELENSNGIIITGDTISGKVIEIFQKTGKEVIAVRGNCDYFEYPKLPEYKEFEANGKKIGVIHSHQCGRGNIDKVTEFAREKELDVLVFGHTHQSCIKRYNDGLLLLNPGTATGTTSGSGYKAGKTYAIFEINNEVNAEVRAI